MVQTAPEEWKLGSILSVITQIGEFNLTQQTNTNLI
jgi:hypothetical protein